MYWRPVTQIVSLWPFGGVGASIEADRTPFASLFGGFWIELSFEKVISASATRITAAPTVQEISRRVLPWICAATRPFFARNLKTEYSSAPSTTTKTTIAMY